MRIPIPYLNSFSNSNSNSNSNSHSSSNFEFKDESDFNFIFCGKFSFVLVSFRCSHHLTLCVSHENRGEYGVAMEGR